MNEEPPSSEALPALNRERSRGLLYSEALW